MHLHFYPSRSRAIERISNAANPTRGKGVRMACGRCVPLSLEGSICIVADTYLVTALDAVHTSPASSRVRRVARWGTTEARRNRSVVPRPRYGSGITSRRAGMTSAEKAFPPHLEGR